MTDSDKLRPKSLKNKTTEVTLFRAKSAVPAGQNRVKSSTERANFNKKHSASNMKIVDLEEESKGEDLKFLGYHKRA